MLSETMAQYSALMVMEKEFGPANMRKFLEYELNSYLVGRSTERQRELPLELVENQPYIHYNKGSLVMYALRDYLGEARMNAAIRGFLDATKFRGPPYPTSLQLVDSLRAATPDSLKYLITDLFETSRCTSSRPTPSTAARRAGRYRGRPVRHREEDARRQPRQGDGRADERLDRHRPVRQGAGEAGPEDRRQGRHPDVPAEAPHPQRGAEDHGGRRRAARIAPASIRCTS